MKQSAFCYLVSLLFTVLSVLGVLIASENHGVSFVAACVFWCSGCIIEMLEKKQ